MLAERQKLTTNTLTYSEGVNLQVKDVYVPLGLVERKKISKRENDSFPDKGSELYQELEIIRKFENQEFLEQVLKQKNTPKSKGNRIAIIGEPGAGKTTLLQQIVDYLSQEINQSIIIWISLADLQGEKLEKYLFDTWLTAASHRIGQAEATDQMKNDFVTQLKQSQVWLLLDGLDEISVNSGNALTDIARQIRESGCINQARIVLTCRLNLWDGSSNALNDFDTYRTLDFSYPEQVEKFIDKWFTAISEPDRERGKRLCNTLKESGKERIRDLVKNPLRLTLLCLNWQAKEGKLPDTQAGFYQQLVDDFYKWKKDEFTTKAAQRQQLNIKLGELAREAIDKEATRFRLRGEFVNQFLGDADDENSLLNLALKLGWLNKVGEDTDKKPVYAFFHASFQEYFASTAINDWDFFLPRNHKNKPVINKKYRIFEPQWKQTILLWFGRRDLRKEEKEAFIKALIDFQDGCVKYKGKGFYGYRAYFLAAATITEFKDCDRADEIVKQIVNWELGYFGTIKEQVTAALQETERTKAITALVQLLDRSKDEDTRRLVANSLGKIDPGNEKVIAALVQLLNTSESDSKRWQAADSLGKIDPGNEKAISTLVKLLDESKDNFTRWQAAGSLGKIGIGNEQAISVLLQLIKPNQVDYYTYPQVAQSLEKIGIGNEQVISAFIQLLISDEVNDKIRKLAVSSLEKIGTGNETAIAALLQILLSTDVNNTTIKLVAESLGKIGIGNEKAITALAQLLTSNEVNDYIYRLAVISLGQIAIDNQQAINTLEQLLNLNGVDKSIRLQAAKSLGLIHPGNQQAINTLEQLLNLNGVDNSIRLQAAKSLELIHPGNQQAINTLEQLLNLNGVDNSIRLQAAKSLLKINRSNEQAIGTLTQLLNSTDVNKRIRKQAVSSLGTIDIGNEAVITALVKVLTTNKVNDSICSYAVQSLGQIAQDNEKAISALLHLLISDEIGILTLAEVTQSLKQIGTGNEQAITALGEILLSNTVDKYKLVQVAETLKNILENNQFAKLVIQFKHYLNDSRLFVACYSVIYYCSQNMPYPEFYQAWHQPHFYTRLVQTVKSIFQKDLNKYAYNLKNLKI
ncbi:HEAT repeat domain-containing protein [Anabaena sphaerica FACHB-251]|uniref:HEAT repeat domain-containing protein n=1 Tax=Anabaena sphaerica FACHB-251 TaxID=2692883 RepID=A0A926WFC4_9NOST|nr:HEAT repeat domain-containing protein [Anabaena sphaerica]MBD2292829.1 HEAT repeat domain-containing protein [Anabaena sphaerica FACHB-251]